MSTIKVSVKPNSRVYIIAKLTMAGLQVDSATWDAVTFMLEEAAGLWVSHYFETLLVPEDLIKLIEMYKERGERT
jgi:hypothetical protein